jgi:CheY-like chemotaxis protein
MTDDTDKHACKQRCQHNDSLSGSSTAGDSLAIGQDDRQANLLGNSRSLLLLVEDDLDDVLLFQRALAKARVANVIRCAQNGTKALEILSDLGPGITSVCLVSDSRLPDMTGMQLLAIVRRTAWKACVKFAFLTGNSDPLAEGRARTSGADAFFLKPSSSADLIGVARTIGELADGR